MNKPSVSQPPLNLKKITGIIFLMLLSAGFAYFTVSTVLSRQSGIQAKNDDVDIIHLNGTWWETRRLIYHGIPARCVLKLPKATSEEHRNHIISAVWQTFDHIGSTFNPFDPDSEIHHLNTLSQPAPVPVSDDMFTVLSISKQIWQDTNGFFDPTMWQIKQLWQKAEKTQQVPSEKDITDALQRTGFDQVRLLNQTSNFVAYANHPVKFDLGGMVKGFAVDRVREKLLQEGITAGLVQLGGEISAFGDNDDKPWRIGIQHPKEMDTIWGVIAATKDLRVSTSGNYRQPILIAGKSFYHIFSPKTGKPVSEKVLGVTTVSFDREHSNAWLDGVATAITVMGPRKGFEQAKKLGIDVLILYEKQDGSMGALITPGLSMHYTRNGK